MERYNVRVMIAEREAEGKGTLSVLRWIQEQTGTSDTGLPGVKWLADILRVRNCLVHRAGIVLQQDVVNGALDVRWRRACLAVDGVEAGRPPFRVNEGALVEMVYTDTGQTRRIGESIVLGEQDCDDIAMSLFALVEQLLISVEHHLVQILS